MRRKFIPFTIGFRIDTGLQFPPVLSPIPHFKPSKSSNTIFDTEYNISCYLHYFSFK